MKKNLHFIVLLRRTLRRRIHKTKVQASKELAMATKTGREKTGPKILYRQGIGNAPMQVVPQRKPLAEVVLALTGKPLMLTEQPKRTRRG